MEDYQAEQMSEKNFFLNVAPSPAFGPPAYTLYKGFTKGKIPKITF